MPNLPHAAKECRASDPSTQDLGVVNAFPKLSPSPRRGACQIVSERLIDGIRLDSASSDYFYLFYQCKAVQGWYAGGLMFADLVAGNRRGGILCTRRIGQIPGRRRDLGAGLSTHDQLTLLYF
jgi:hypothetical protein